MNRKNILFFLSTILLGVIIGVSIKYGGIAVQDNAVLSKMIRAIGLTGNGLFLWTAICTIISMLSKSKKLAAINVFSFLASMIVANYLYSYFVAGYFALRVVIFWVVMLIPCTFLGYTIWDIKTNKKIMKIKLKIPVIIIGTAIMIYDMFISPCLIQFLTSAIIITVLYVMFLVSISTSKRIEN